MMRVIEALLFLSLATGLQVGLWSVAPQITGATSTGNADQTRLSLAVATPQQAALARSWQDPPDIASQGPAPAHPGPRPAAADKPLTQHPISPPIASPSPVLPVALPAPDPIRRADTAPPALPDAPPAKADTQAPARSTDPISEPPQSAAAHAASLRPRARPARTQEPADTARAKVQTAAASALAQSTKGARGKDKTQSISTAERNALKADWGARIQSKVHRQLIYPRGATGSGSVRVALTIDRAGQLTALELIQTSGVAAFDDAAVRAVRKASRFPAAPKTLPGASHTFTLSLAFRP